MTGPSDWFLGFLGSRVLDPSHWFLTDDRPFWLVPGRRRALLIGSSFVSVRGPLRAGGHESGGPAAAAAAPLIGCWPTSGPSDWFLTDDGPFWLVPDRRQGLLIGSWATARSLCRYVDRYERVGTSLVGALLQPLHQDLDAPLPPAVTCSLEERRVNGQVGNSPP
jgi:hypothetical protein